MGIDDAAVRDAKVIESVLPSDEGISIGASEPDVIKSDTKLRERVVNRNGVRVFVESDQRPDG